MSNGCSRRGSGAAGSAWRKKPEASLGFANEQAARAVQLKCGESGAASGRLSDDFCVRPFKMRVPEVLAGMEQRDHGICIRVLCGDSIRLVQIATRAGQGEVCHVRSSAESAGHDVFDVKGGTLKRLAHAAVLTAIARPSADLGGQLQGHDHAGCLPSRCKACARRSETFSLHSTSAASSLRSALVRTPSLLRSISVCKRRSAFLGSERRPTDATQDFGADMTADMANQCAEGQPLSIHTVPGRVILPQSRSAHVRLVCTIKD